MKSNITILDDTSGTGIWRAIWPINLLWPHLSKDEQITVCQSFPPDPNFLAIQNTIMIQRFSLPEHKVLFDQAILPARVAGTANIIYNIDDVMSGDVMPKFNRAHLHYSRPEVQERIRYFLQNTDFMLVTTNILKQFYVDYYGVDPNNFLIVPNMLPRSWAFGLYNENQRLANFHENKQHGKVRVCLISSASHFNVAGLKWSIADHDPVGNAPKPNGKYESYVTHKEYDEKDVEMIPDDIDDIIDIIDETSSKIEWICIGQSKSEKFIKLVKENKIKIVNQTDILHYMQLIYSLQPDAVIAPIKDTLFNHCKSDIKYLECAAIGALLYAPNYMPYTEHVPKDQLWTSNDDLRNKLFDLAKMNDDEYLGKIHVQYDFLNKPMQTQGAPLLNSMWLDDNIDIWKQILFMPRNGLKITLKQIVTDENLAK